MRLWKCKQQESQFARFVYSFVWDDAAHRYSKDSQVDAALSKAVESLHSYGEYRSVMSEIARPKESK